MTIQDLYSILPELILTGTVVLILAADFFSRKGVRLSDRWSATLACLGLIGALIGLWAAAPLGSAKVFSGLVAIDPMALFFKGLFAVAALIVVVLSQKARELEAADQPSYYLLLLVLTVGLMFLATSVNLLMVYLSLEMVSLISYLLTASLKGVRRGTEASLKYVIYGGVSSGIMVYGMSLIYGLTGSLELTTIGERLFASPADPALLLSAIVLVFVGFAFKVAAVPFHMWAPDVYEGAPTPMTAFFSVGPKAAGFAALIRFCGNALSLQTPAGWWNIEAVPWPQVLAVLSVATMTLGNLVALRQTNLKRLLAYSSIAHAGYLLMALAAWGDDALRAVLFYLVVYLVMNLGAFLIVLIVLNQSASEEITAYTGLGRRGGAGALLAVVFTIFLLSLTGIPPFAGFVGKFYLFSAVIERGLYGLALIGVLNSVVSLYYYVRIVKVMFLDAPEDPAPAANPPARYVVLALALAILTVYWGVLWNSLAGIASASARMVF